MSVWNLNGRYVPDKAAITHRSAAVLEVHERNIKSAESALEKRPRAGIEKQAVSSNVSQDSSTTF